MTRIIELADGSQVTAAQFRAQNPRVQYGGEVPSVAYLETIGAAIVPLPTTDPTPENVVNAPKTGFGGPTIKEQFNGNF